APHGPLFLIGPASVSNICRPWFSRVTFSDRNRIDEPCSVQFANHSTATTNYPILPGIDSLAGWRGPCGAGLVFRPCRARKPSHSRDLQFPRRASGLEWFARKTESRLAS